MVLFLNFAYTSSYIHVIELLMVEIHPIDRPSTRKDISLLHGQ